MSKGWGVPKQATAMATMLCALVSGLLLACPPALAASSGENDASCANTTFSGFTVALPDCRAYEMVSPALGNQEVYSSERTDVSEEEDVPSKLPFRASADGSGVAYVADPPSAIEEGSGNSGDGGGNEWIGRRSPTGGWRASDITPANITAVYQGFTNNLSTGFLKSYNNPPLFPSLTQEIAETPSLTQCQLLFSSATDNPSYHPFFATTQTPHFCGGEDSVELAFDGASTDGTRLFFHSAAALIPGVDEAAGEGREYNLYESVDGRVSAVNVLDGKPDPNATFGAPEAEDGQAGDIDLSNAISADGSRVFWTDLNTGIVYVREDGTTTVPVSEGPATFWTATPDGRYAYYTENEQLWRFDAKGEVGHQHEEIAGEGLTHESAGVQGVVGINESGEDGAYVYFVATGSLAGNENARKETAEAGKPNLYVHHDGLMTFIATLSSEDGGIVGIDSHIFGDWQGSLAMRTVEVAADGKSLAFLSRQPLTGYDNIEQTFHRSPTRVSELFVYDVDTERIVCASCDPSGAPPAEKAPEGSKREAKEGGAFVPSSWNNTYMPRWFSEDGNRVFFDTVESLLPQDTNHRLQDVYEWERNGVGSCAAVAAGEAETGCIFLISSGSSADYSYLVDASANGDDVFFSTREPLVSQDQNVLADLYDARVGGGFAEASLACTGTGCQGVPPPAPIFATPSSVTFNGVGNFASSPMVTEKPKSKVVKCRRGFVKKHAKCVKGRARHKKAKAKRAGANRRGKS